jgi:flagellar assembly factor FliW
MTMNLAGPIVVNAESRRAMQVVLEDERYPVRFPAFRIESDAA